MPTYLRMRARFRIRSFCSYQCHSPSRQTCTHHQQDRVFSSLLWRPAGPGALQPSLDPDHLFLLCRLRGARGKGEGGVRTCRTCRTCRTYRMYKTRTRTPISIAHHTNAARDAAVAADRLRADSHGTAAPTPKHAAVGMRFGLQACRGVDRCIVIISTTSGSSSSNRAIVEGHVVQIDGRSVGIDGFAPPRDHRGVFQIVPTCAGAVCEVLSVRCEV